MQLTNIPDSQSGCPRWSPDGRLIVFNHHDDAGNLDICVVPADGGPVQRLTSEPSIEARPCYSTDGRWIFFRSDKSGARRFYRMPADVNPHPAATWQQVVASDAVEAYPSIDGKLLFFARSSGSGLFSVPVEGGPESNVVGAGRNSLWSLTERAIYYLDTTIGQTWTVAILDTGVVSIPLMRFDIKTGVTTRAGEINASICANSAPAIAVSRDERFLIYVRRNQPTADLMLVENFR